MVYLYFKPLIASPLLLLLVLPPSFSQPSSGTRSSPIKEYVDRFAMPITTLDSSNAENGTCTTYHRIQSTLSWTTRTMGRCQQSCRSPTRMNTAAYNNTVLVSWAGSTPTFGGEQDQTRRRFGHLSTFTFTETEGFTKVSDYWYPNCNFDMGEIAVNTDGSVIGALCVAEHDMLIPTALGEPQFGVNSAAGRRRKLYLYEWTGGQVTQTPDKIVLLQTNIGGANYGHWSISLNNNATQYFLKLKVSVHNGNHESAVSYYINRNSQYARDASVSRGTSCGSGHTISNRVTHNTHNDLWSMYCGTDKRRQISWVDTTKTRAPLAEFPGGQIDYPAGGASNMISLGANGMMVTALGPPDIFESVNNKEARIEALKKQKIGVRALPLTAMELLSETNENAYPWTWITPCVPTQYDEPRAGIVQVHNWGMGGESSGRTLLGYSPAMQFQGTSKEYHAVEINQKGEFLHDPVILQTSAWGEDSLGVHMPGSGCVVFPFAWTGSAERAVNPRYPKMKDAIDDRSIFLRLTALCPDDTVPRKEPFSTCTATQSTQVINATLRDLPVYSETCPASSFPFMNVTDIPIFPDTMAPNPTSPTTANGMVAPTNTSSTNMTPAPTPATPIVIVVVREQHQSEEEGKGGKKEGHGTETFGY